MLVLYVCVCVFRIPGVRFRCCGMERERGGARLALLRGRALLPPFSPPSPPPLLLSSLSHTQHRQTHTAAATQTRPSRSVSLSLLQRRTQPCRPARMRLARAVSANREVRTQCAVAPLSSSRHTSDTRRTRRRTLETGARTRGRVRRGLSPGARSGAGCFHAEPRARGALWRGPWKRRGGGRLGTGGRGGGGGRRRSMRNAGFWARAGAPPAVAPLAPHRPNARALTCPATTPPKHTNTQAATLRFALFLVPRRRRRPP
jgi:hypothetical protein